MGKKEAEPSSFIDNMIVYVENVMQSTKTNSRTKKGLYQGTKKQGQYTKINCISILQFKNNTIQNNIKIYKILQG